jgi:hypothetical protein
MVACGQSQSNALTSDVNVGDADKLTVRATGVDEIFGVQNRCDLVLVPHPAIEWRRSSSFTAEASGWACSSHAFELADSPPVPGPGLF